MDLSEGPTCKRFGFPSYLILTWCMMCDVVLRYNDHADIIVKEEPVCG